MGGAKKCPDFRTLPLVFYPQKQGKHRNLKEDKNMKGYYNHSGYMGYVDGGWVLFASESDYLDYMEE